MQFNETLHDGQSETKSAVTPAAFRLPEGFEQMRQVLCGDAFARIGDREAKKGVTVFQSGCYGSAARCELHRIRYEIPDDLLEAIGIQNHEMRTGGHNGNNFDSFCFC